MQASYFLGIHIFPVWRGQARPALAPPSGTQVASHSFEYRATWPAAGARARPGHQLAGRKGCVSCRSCVSCMCAGHWPEEYFGLVCPLARTRARGDKPRAGTGHVPPAGVGSRPPPPEPGRVTSPQSPAWTSQRGCPPQLTARAEGGTECGAGPLHACGRPQPVRLRPVGPSRSPCHHHGRAGGTNQTSISRSVHPRRILPLRSRILTGDSNINPSRVSSVTLVGLRLGLAASLAAWRDAWPATTDRPVWPASRGVTRQD